MIAGIDVGHRNVVIAYKKNNRIKFIKVRREIENDKTAYSILEKFIQNGISEVAIENPEILKKDALKDKSGESYERLKDIISFLEKLKEILEFSRIKVILVSPRKTDHICPICKEEIRTGAFHYLYCPKCDIAINRDEIASWNVLRRGEKIKVVANG